MQIKAVNDHFRQQKEKYVVKFCHTMFEHLFMKTVKIPDMSITKLKNTS